VCLCGRARKVESALKLAKAENKRKTRKSEHSFMSKGKRRNWDED